MPRQAGIEVEEDPGPDQSIARLPSARSAFVGRTLRGPINRPVLVKSFTEFQHVFGGLWQPSSLGYAVEQFFDHGGREALIVRVVNGARPATVSLRAGTAVLRLRAVRPGTREFLRASVDYDNVPADDDSSFNLTLQRVRAQGTAQVEDQEIFHRLSMDEGSERYLPRVIADSELIALEGALPDARPDRTLDAASGLATGYVLSSSDGDDGAPLTDYDVIGSPGDRTGLFALGPADQFNFLCIPPLSRERDVGSSVLLVASRFCRDRRALLIVDPPAQWVTADDALQGLHEWNLFSDSALMYFPRLLALDKLRGHFEAFAPCGAIAGMLARGEETAPVWAPVRNEEAVLRPGYRPTCMVSEDRRIRLASLGVNTLQAVRSATRIGVAARTLAAGAATDADWKYLASRRFALFVVNCIERGTRWVAMARPPLEVAQLAVAQVRAFFEGLAADGAFGDRPPGDAYFVACDPAVEFQLLIGFASRLSEGFHGFRITHTPRGSTVKPLNVNPLSTSLSPIETEWVDGLVQRLTAHGPQ